MSRSRKHSPCIQVVGKTDKLSKRIANRRFRKRIRIALRSGRDFLPLMREVANRYEFAKEGTVHWINEGDYHLGGKITKNEIEKWKRK
jgi:hypothetical protein